MNIKNFHSKVFGLFVSGFLILHSYSIIDMYSSGVSPVPGYDYLFPISQFASFSASLITILFILAYIFEPNILIDRIKEYTKLEFNQNIEGFLYVLLCGTFWLVFGLQVANGIQAFEISVVLNESVDFSGITEISVILNQLILFIPFVVVPLSYISVVDSRNVSEVIDFKTNDLLNNIVIGILSVFLILLTVGVVNLTLAQLLNLESENLAINQITQLGPWFALFISLTAGFTEEIFFRGFIQKKVGLFAASFLFAITHAGYGILIQIIGPFIFGLLIGWIYYKTKNLIVPITAHVVYNLLVLLISIYFPGI